MSELRTLVFLGPIARKVDAHNAFLARAGFRVVVAERGAQILDVSGKDRPELVVLALDTPGLPGDELVARLRQIRGAEAPSFILTCGASEDERQRCRASGAQVVLAEPWTREELLQKAALILGIPPRTARRVLVGIEVTSQRDNREPFFGTIVNLSTGGALLQTYEQLEPGTRVILSFTLPGNDRRINRQAHVVRQERDLQFPCFGVRFDDPPTDADARAIEEFIERQS